MSICDIKSKNFLEAIRRNRTKEVEARLAIGQDVGEKFAMNRTGLHCAISHFHIKMVEILLGAGADLSQRDSNGDTSLHVACSRSGPDSLQIVRMLLGSGQSLPLQMKNKFNRTALDECVWFGSVENAKLLLLAGASVEESTKILVLEKNNAEMMLMMESFNISVSISVKDERENLTKRIAELKIHDLESQLIVKKQELQKYRSNFTKFKNKVKTEIMKKDEELMEVEKQQLEIEKDLNERIEQLNKRVQDKNKALLALRKEMEERKISVKDERENLMKRIYDLETQLIAKKQNLQKYRSNYAKSKKKGMTEIMEKDEELVKAEKQQMEVEKDQMDLNKRIEQLNKQVQNTNKALLALRKEMEERKTETNALIKEKEIENRALEITNFILSTSLHRKITIEKQDLSNILQCPVCLDNCKPPLQIWQCREGHILCESCFSRPELKTCPQCRMSLQGNVSRSRVLEELAMKLFPHKVKTPRKLFPHKVKTPRQSYRNHLTIAFPNNGRNRRSPL